MSEKLLSECSAEERDEIARLEKRIRKLKKYISLGYLTEKGKDYFTKELMKDVNKVEKGLERYCFTRNENEQLRLF